MLEGQKHWSRVIVRIFGFVLKQKKLFLPTHTHIALNYFNALGTKDNHLCVHLSLKRLKLNIFVTGFQTHLKLPFEIMRDIFRENTTRS